MMPNSVVCGGATYFSRIVRALVVVARELAVDGQPERLAVVAAAGKADRELDPRAAAGDGLDVRRVLPGREHLLEQRRELHLAEDAAGLDVAEHAAERTDVLGEQLHLAEAAVH